MRAHRADRVSRKETLIIRDDQRQEPESSKTIRNDEKK